MFSNNSSFADLDPAPEEEIELTPGVEGSPWSDMINLRLVQDGHLNVLKPRGAATPIKDKGGNDVVDGNNALIQYSVSARLPYGPRNFIVIHFDDGSVHVFCEEDQYLINFVGVNSFSTTEPVKVAISGHFLYLFSPAEEVASYCDLSKLKADDITPELTLHRWLAHSTKNGSTPSDGARTVDEEEDNIFGLDVGAKVIAFPHFPENPTGESVAVQPIRLREERLDEHYNVVQEAFEVPGHYLVKGSHYEYTYKGGSYLMERRTGRTFKELDKTIQIKPGTDGWHDELEMIINPDDGTGTGIDYTLLEMYSWSQRPNSAVTPFETFITRSDGGAGTHNVYVTGPEGEEHSISKTDSLYKAVLATVDTDPLIDRGAKFFKDENGAIEENLDYEHPKMVRGYRFVDILDDGSTTAPSAIITHEVPVDSLANTSGKIREINVKIPAAPSNISARYIYATRWMISEKHVFRASSKNYPNGPFFFHSEIKGKAYAKFIDNKQDADLTQPMSSAVPLAGGIPTLVSPNNGESGIIPKSVTSLKGSMIFGGFRMKRPVPTKEYNTFKTVDTTTGSGKAGTAKILFKYSNGDYSTVTEYAGLLSTETHTLSVMAPSAIVTSIEVYFAEDGLSTHLVGEYDSSTPEFNGYGIVLSSGVLADAATEVATVPTTSEQKPDLELDNYITSSAPPQMLTIDRSTKIVDNSLITNIIVEKFDADKAVLRYKILIMTNENIQYGYLTDADQNGMPIYRGDFEIISSQTAVTPDAIGNLGTASFFEGENGINIASGGGITEVIDNDSILNGSGDRLINGNVTSIVYNKRYNEIFIVIGSQAVVVYGIDSKTTKIFDYGTAIQAAVRSSNKLYAIKDTGSFTGLFELEDYSNQVSEIACSVTSRPIGTPRVNTRILEATLYGEGFGTIFKIDLQPGRKEGQTGWNKVFDGSAVTLPKRDLQMYGVSYGVGYAGHMPRIQLDMTGTTEAFLSDVILRTVQTPNTGKARE